jgi:hypothetical protein
MICKLLRAIAGNTDAHRYRYDTTLIGAAETIEAFDIGADRTTGLALIGLLGWFFRAQNYCEKKYLAKYQPTHKCGIECHSTTPQRGPRAQHSQSPMPHIGTALT